MKKHLSYNDLFYYISITNIFIVIFFMPYVVNITHSSSTLIMLIIAGIIFLLLSFIKSPKIKKGSTKYLLLSISCLIPCFYKNAYLIDGHYYKALLYILVIIYFMILYLKRIDERKIMYIINFIILFAILTSLITWLGFAFPNVYISKIIPLLPVESRLSVLNTFPNINPGLTSHYSRNAFFITIGIMGLLLKYKNTKNKKYFITILFLIVTLFLVGKRGHLVFLILSFMLSYFIYYKIKLKTILKVCSLIVLFILFSFLVVKIIPSTNKVFERLFDYEQLDYSNGRQEMYSSIRTMYQNNNKNPIGWGQYSKNTNYYHPGVHNDYIQLYYETGIIGFLMIIGANIIFLISSIKAARKSDNYLVFIVLMYDIFYMLYSLTGIPHYDFETYAVYFMLNCSLFCLIENLKQNNEVIQRGGTR